jgi:cell wall-associated NlpC family hydrolase
MADGQRLVEKARAKIGADYKWGGDGPNAFDCSGFVAWVHRDAGYTMDRQKVNTFTGFTEVTSPLPGDVVSGPGHVGIYVSDNQMIHASDEKGGVKLGTYSWMETWKFYRYW